MKNQLSEGQIPAEWTHLTSLATLHSKRPTRVSVDPISQEIRLPEAYSAALDGDETDSAVSLTLSQKAELRSSVDAVLTTTQSETHVYDVARLLSACLALESAETPSIELPGFVADASTAGKSLLRLLVESRLTTAGRRYQSRSADQPSDPQASPHIDPAEIDAPTYSSLAAALANRFAATWQIDPFEYAFRFVTGTHQLLSPDQVVVCAARIDLDRVAQLDWVGQVELLVDTVQEATFEDQVAIIDDDDVLADLRVQTVSRREVQKTHRRRLLELVSDKQLYSMLPLVATSYPGSEQQRSLSTIIHNLYAVSTDARKLYLDKRGAEWARDTLLLKLSIDLWQEYVEQVLYPSYDRFSSVFSTESASHLQRAIKEEYRLSHIHPRLSRTGSVLDETRGNQMPITEQSDSHLTARLDRLGRAIATQDESKIAEFL